MGRKKAVRSAQSTASGPSVWSWRLVFFALAVIPVFLWPWMPEPFDLPKSLLLQLVGFVALGCLTARALEGGSLIATVRTTLSEPLSVGVALFGVSAILSTVLSSSPLTSLQGQFESFAGLPTLLALIALYFATLVACPDWQKVPELLAAPIAASAIIVAYALVQVFGLDPLSWSRAAEREFLPQVESFLGFRSVRPFATLGSANTLSAFLACAWPLQAAWFLQLREEGRIGAARVLATVMALSTLVILRCSVRAGLIAIAIAVLGTTLAIAISEGGTWARRMRILVPSLAAVVVVVGLLPTSRALLDDLGRRYLGATGAGSRAHLWSTALEVFREHPFTGAGVDTFGLMYTARRTPESWAIEWNTTFVRAHNEFLQILATQGLLGAVAIVIASIGLVIGARRAWRKLESVGERRFLGCILVAIAALAPQAMVGLLQTSPLTLGVVLAAIVTIASRSGPSSRVGEGTSSIRMLPGFALLVGLAFLGPTAAGYAAAQRSLESRMTDSTRALVEAERATTLDPRNAGQWRRLSEVALTSAGGSSTDATELRRRARAALERAVDLQPLVAQYDMLLCRAIGAQVVAKEARGAEALAACDSAIRKEPSNPFFHTAGVNAAVQAGDWAGARARADAGLRVYPSFGPLIYQRGFVALNENAIDEAIRLLTAADAAEWHGQTAGREGVARALVEARRRRSEAAPSR